MLLYNQKEKAGAKNKGVTKVTIREFIQKCGITISGPEGKENIKEANSSAVTLDVYVGFVRDQRDRVIAEVKAMAAEGVKVTVTEKVEGLNALREAINAEANYRHEVNRRMESEVLSSIMPEKPAVSVVELKAEYPRAAAYITAEGWSRSSNIGKSRAGKKALERIVAGENHEQVLADMEAEWSEYAEARMWD